MPDDTPDDPWQAIADLRRERDEALAREAATAEVLQVINSSPGDLVTVFDTILDKAMRLCEVAFGVLWTYDGEYMHAAATRGVPAQMVAFLRQGPHPPARVVQQTLLGGVPYEQIADLRLTDGYRAGDPLPRAGADLAGVRTLLGVALRKNDKLVGVFATFRREVRPFSDKQIALLQNFAAQAVIAMENARLITETKEALDQQTATAEVLGVINASPGDLAPVFDAMLEKVVRLCEADCATLYVLDGERAHPAAVRGVSAIAEWARQIGDFIPPPGSSIDRLRRGERFVRLLDARETEAYRDSPLYREMIDISGCRSSIAVALRKEDIVPGVIVLYRQEMRPFSDKQLALLENFAAQAVIAMENARLITETKEALDQQTATAEVLGVINSSPGNLAPVFRAMLDRALHLCDASFGVMAKLQGEQVHIVAERGIPEGLAEYQREPYRVVPGTPMHRFLAGEPIVHIADMVNESVPNPRRQAYIELGGARSSLAVPLRKNGSVLGAFIIYRQHLQAFSDKQLALLQNFAAQAVIAMENARLLNELRERTEEVAGWNRELEARVAAQLAEIERTGKLRRFLAPQLADLIVAQGDESILESHRREIVVVFSDLRGFTGFAERAEPEEVMALLKDYHAAMGPIVAQYEGTIDHFSGDGIMVFFNDPLPTPDPARRAIDMAVAMRERAQPLLRLWRRHGHDLGFGVGIAQGYATLGQIGFAERMDYTAIGTVTNLAARLCAEAKDGQILVSSRVATAIEDSAELEEIGDLALKGLSQAVAVYNVAL